MDSADDFGDFLDRWLAEQRWSQGRLAHESGISQGLISKWVHSDRSRRSVPSPRNLEKLAPVLGVPYEDLMRLGGYLPGELAGEQPLDPALASVVARWPRLSAGVREAIGILVGTGPAFSGRASRKVDASDDYGYQRGRPLLALSSVGS